MDKSIIRAIGTPMHSCSSRGYLSVGYIQGDGLSVQLSTVDTPVTLHVLVCLVGSSCPSLSAWQLAVDLAMHPYAYVCFVWLLLQAPIHAPSSSGHGAEIAGSPSQ